MANTIKPKRSNTASKVPNTSELVSGELGVNMADKKVYINNGTSVVQVGAGTLSALESVTITTPTNGQVLSYNGTAWVNAAGGGSGTVTSVGITPSTGVTVSNSPITTSGNITVGLSTKLTAIENLSGSGFITQNGSGAIAGRTIQAGTGISVAHGNGASQDPTISNSGVLGVTATSPVASSGGQNPVISMPAATTSVSGYLTSTDWNTFNNKYSVGGALGTPSSGTLTNCTFPTLNQNTTGTAANVTGTVAIANGGTGQTTRQNAMDALAGAVTSGQYLRGNGTDVVMSAIQAADVPTLNQNTTGSSGSCTGNAATATTATNAGQLNSLTKVQMWNNSGQNHSTYQSFGAIPNFGVWFMQNSAAGDVPQSGQFYTNSVGLGNDYSYSQYAMQTAVLRNTTNPYQWIRYKEATSWGAWTKTAAGYADTAGTATTATTATNQSGGTVNATTGAFSGAASFAAGTQAAPSITRTGNTNTGMFFPATNQLALVSAGFYSFTLSPGFLYSNYFNAEFHNSIQNEFTISSSYDGDSAGKASLLIEADRGDSTNYPSVIIKADSDFDTISMISYKASSPLIFGTANAERMRINNLGNVGIGTTSPTSKLNVNGQITARYNSLSNIGTACDFSTNHMIKVSVSGNKTLTATVPPSGTQAIVMLSRTNTSAATITFGTGFKSTGPVVTSTTNQSAIIVSFVSDGGFLWEASRTTSMV